MNTCQYLKTHVVSHCLMFLFLFLICEVHGLSQHLPNGTIDRKAVVTRHNLVLNNPKFEGPTQVGNGHFSYGFDITGMQTFNDQFVTMSDWSWHSTKLPKGMQVSDFKMTTINTHGRLISYPYPNASQPELTQWLASNPHRFNLGRIGLYLLHKDGSQAQAQELKNPTQSLNLWTGVAESYFTLDGDSVKVTTICDSNRNLVSFKIESALISKHRLGISITFPYANLNYFSNASDYHQDSLHQTVFKKTSPTSATFERQLDSTRYQVFCTWTGSSKIQKKQAHQYYLLPSAKQSTVSYTFDFVSSSQHRMPHPTFTKVLNNSKTHWAEFWKSGGVVDLSQSTDPRWFELERRIVLSQYLMAINAAGNYPPQETGLVSNSWYGRFHYEMYWWHEAQWALWDRWPLLNRSLSVYQDNLSRSEQRAKSQGYEGARWPKCTGPNGIEWPDVTHALLIWQQPHPIFFANLDYRAHPTQAVLQKWDSIVEQTAHFLASYAFLDSTRNAYVLGPPLKTVPENNDPLHAFNPAFELEYWRYGLITAQHWRNQLHLAPNEQWNEVLKKMSPIPVQDGLYVQWEGIDSMWTKYNYEHPAMAGIFGVLPGYDIDTTIMRNTYWKIKKVWNLNHVWGWDFPMMAMNAARLGYSKDAVDWLLNPSSRFQFDEHGLVGGGNPYPYFPSNGGLLYAVAMMTAGWDGDLNTPQPGFPHDGTWVVRWENLKKAP